MKRCAVFRYYLTSKCWCGQFLTADELEYSCLSLIGLGYQISIPAWYPPGVQKIFNLPLLKASFVERHKTMSF